ncbi:MAG TPA: WbqC family protein, partial [Nitrosomonas europaea]|nr:WbqC family protein [Nitrosomonas europaea]
FTEIAAWLEPLYLAETFTHISQLNRRFIEAICNYLGIKTVIKNSWDYTLLDGKTERLADLCVQAGGTEYISGPAAKDYVDEQVFKENGIKLTWFDYIGYPEYQQLWGEFTHGVTILDLLLNCGKNAKRYMKYVE